MIDERESKTSWWAYPLGCLGMLIYYPLVYILVMAGLALSVVEIVLACINLNLLLHFLTFGSYFPDILNYTTISSNLPYFLWNGISLIVIGILFIILEESIWLTFAEEVWIWSLMILSVLVLIVTVWGIFHW